MNQPYTCGSGCPFLGCPECAYRGWESDAAQANPANPGALEAGPPRYDKRANQTPASTGIDRGRGQTSEESDMPSVPTSETPTSVYLYFDALDVLIYVGVTSRGVKRQREHNDDKDWWQFVARQEVRHFATRPEALAEERRLIQKHMPPFNRVHNPGHAAARSSYFTLQAARAVSLSTTERKAIRRGLPLTVMSEPLPGHTFTLFSSAIDSAALTGELDRSRLTSAPVSTPQRLKSGRIVEARYAAGMLLLGITGKYLPDEIHRARAMVSVVMNRKPAGFEIKRVLLNENDDNATKLATREV